MVKLRYITEKIINKIYFIFTSSYFRFVHHIDIGSKCRIDFRASLRGNIKIGNNVSIGKYCNISGNVSIGNDTNISEFAYINTMPTGKIEIGEDCHINIYNIIGSSKKVEIKDHALFAAGVKITDASHSIKDIDVLIKKADIESKSMVIEENCWLGFDVNVIMGGAIGKNSVIGSKSLVNSQISSDSIAVGIPAKVIKKRQSFEK